MSKRVEYLNPKPYAIQLSSPEKKIIKVPANAKIVLSEWYMSYCPKYLRVVRVLDESDGQPIEPRAIPNNVKYAPTDKPRPVARRERVVQAPPPTAQVPRTLAEKTSKEQVAPIATKRETITTRKVVGRPASGDVAKLFSQSCQNNPWAISNNIGIGILSYNRLDCVQRLIGSIRAHTDMSRTTVFVSDESTDPAVKTWLSQQTDVVVLTEQPRIGIAGNSNRLLRCLSRFKYGILLNDDVEILNDGWERFYRDASLNTGYHHFCYHQEGVYGARRDPNAFHNVGNYRLETIAEKPHGAVLFFSNEAFQRVGFFDEGFGLYGMEHVDWSDRIGRCGLQPPGFHDVIGSERYFRIHAANSTISNKNNELSQSRARYAELRNIPTRIRVEATAASDVPSISVVIPLRLTDRQAAVEVIVDSIRAQRFPNVEIIIVEQDDQQQLQVKGMSPVRYILARNKYPQQPFTKALAFNIGVAAASYDNIVLQDADIICPANYLATVHKLLEQFEGIHIGSRVLYLNPASTTQIIADRKVSEDKDCERAVTYFEGGTLACRKRTYFKVGGFNEIFEGYGVEDCDFFDRLKNGSNFYDVRTVDLVHLWHGRTEGWEQHHNRNKKINQHLRQQYDLGAYINSLVAKLRKSYPEALQKVGL
jgi:GT2 family glycosyltransferase